MVATAPRPAAAGLSRRPALNLFGVGFGFAGLAGTWTLAGTLGLAPHVVGDVLWWVCALAWSVMLVRWLAAPGGWRAAVADLQHPVLGPFAALAPTTAMLLSARLVSLAPAAGRVGIVGSVALACGFAWWFLAALLDGRHRVEHLHGGYLLPTTAAALVGGQVLAAAGWVTAGRVAWAIGILSWLLVGAVLLARFALRPLPDALVPTLAIFSAPPAVAGNAWYVIGGGALDGVQDVLLGTFVLLVGAQLVLLRRYARLTFALSWWAFTFSAAACATYAVHWLAGTQPVGWRAWSWCAIALVSVLIVGIAVRSVVLVRASRRTITPIGAAAA